MKFHRLKTNSGFFIQVWIGNKTFEIRKNDRDFNEGDFLVLRETYLRQAPPSPYGIVDYTGREILCKVTYMTDFEQKKGFVVLALRRVDFRDENEKPFSDDDLTRLSK